MKTKQTQCKYKIESGIPIPDRAGGPGRGSSYPFDQMKVGDSFLIGNKSARLVSSSAAQWGRVRGKKLAVRTEGDGARVWRIK